MLLIIYRAVKKGIYFIISQESNKILARWQNFAQRKLFADQIFSETVSFTFMQVLNKFNPPPPPAKKVPLPVFPL